MSRLSCRLSSCVSLVGRSELRFQLFARQLRYQRYAHWKHSRHSTTHTCQLTHSLSLSECHVPSQLMKGEYSYISQRFAPASSTSFCSEVIDCSMSGITNTSPPREVGIGGSCAWISDIGTARKCNQSCNTASSRVIPIRPSCAWCALLCALFANFRRAIRAGNLQKCLQSL